MSTYKVTDEQLQAIRKELTDETTPDCDGVWYVLGGIKAIAKLLLIALEERDERINELRETGQRIDDELLNAEQRITALEAKCALHAASEAKLDAEVDSLKYNISNLEHCLDCAGNLELDLRAEIAELRKPVNPCQMVANISAEITKCRSLGQLSTTSVLEQTLLWVAQLRKPVAVQPNEAVEAVRRLVNHGYLPTDRNVGSLLSAYDTLAQDLARANSAHDVHMAEIAALIEAKLHLTNLVNENAHGCLAALSERDAAQERERQLREALQGIANGPLPNMENDEVAGWASYIARDALAQPPVPEQRSDAPDLASLLIDAAKSLKEPTNGAV